MKDFFIKLSACILGVISTFFRAYGVILICVAFILVLDFITGLVKAKAIGEPITSKKGTRGFWKKIAKLLALTIGIFLDYFVPLMIKAGVNYKIPFPLPFALTMGVYIVIVELISIMENLNLCGVAIPPYILKLLKGAEKQLENQDNTKGENDNAAKNN